VQHYAGRVQYDAADFLDKNRNFLPPEIVQLLRQSGNEVVHHVFQCPLTKTGNLFAATPYGSPAVSPKLPAKFKMDRHIFDQTTKNVSRLSPFNSFISNFTADDLTTKQAASATAKGLASQTRAQQTVATSFRYSLMDLLHKMIAGTPHFIRCIKPNDNRTIRQFERTKVIQQMQYTGVLETVRIRKLGYSHRLLFADFLRRCVPIHLN
jgi:myosin III